MPFRMYTTAPANWSAQELAAFHAIQFQPHNVTVLVTGSVDGPTAAALVEASFQSIDAPTVQPTGSSGMTSAGSGVATVPGPRAGSGATPGSSGDKPPTSIVAVHHRFDAAHQRTVHVERVAGASAFHLTVTNKAPLSSARSTYLGDVRRTMLDELTEAVFRLRVHALMARTPSPAFSSLR